MSDSNRSARIVNASGKVLATAPNWIFPANWNRRVTLSASVVQAPCFGPEDEDEWTLVSSPETKPVSLPMLLLEGTSILDDSDEKLRARDAVVLGLLEEFRQGRAKLEELDRDIDTLAPPMKADKEWSRVLLEERQRAIGQRQDLAERLEELKDIRACHVQWTAREEKYTARLLPGALTALPWAREPVAFLPAEMRGLVNPLDTQVTTKNYTAHLPLEHDEGGLEELFPTLEQMAERPTACDPFNPENWRTARPAPSPEQVGIDYNDQFFEDERDEFGAFNGFDGNEGFDCLV